MTASYVRHVIHFGSELLLPTQPFTLQRVVVYCRSAIAVPMMLSLYYDCRTIGITRPTTVEPLYDLDRHRSLSRNLCLTNTQYLDIICGEDGEVNHRSL